MIRVLLVSACLLFGVDAAADPEIDALIDELGHDKYAVRRKASRALYRHGLRVVPALRRALDSQDPEVAWRARSVLEALGQMPQEQAEREPFAIRGRVVDTIRYGPELIRVRLNPDTQRLELEIDGRQYPVSSISELRRRYRDVYMQLRIRSFRRMRGRSAPDAQPDWPAIGISLIAARPLGLEVTRLMSKSPAEKLGIKVGDRLVRVQGRLTLEVDDLAAALKDVGVGQAFRIAVVRDGTERVLVGKRSR